jgi:hypothetical protein
MVALEVMPKEVQGKGEEGRYMWRRSRAKKSERAERGNGRVEE